MIRNTFLRTLIITACICSLFSLLPRITQAQEKEKVGILFINVGGGDWNYSPDWIPSFFNNLWGIFPNGMHTGGWMGHDNDTYKCYTQIHYANEEEAAGCGCAEDTLIDVMCNEYPVGTAVYAISEFGPVDNGGDGSYSTDCFPGFGLPYAMHNSADWNSTIDPATGDLIVGPVLDPDSIFNPGQGIAEFHESIAWTRFGYLAEVPNGYDPSKRDWKKWWYGNDADCLDDPNCAPDATEISNIKDSILADTNLTDKYDFVFRHGWEGRMKNLDERGDTLANPYPDSTETALQELIVNEGVDRIVVVHTQPAFANASQYGDEWKQKNFRYDPVDGEPVSRVADKTYKQCVMELDDDYGPGWTQGIANEPQTRDDYLAEKPWENRPVQPWPEIVAMVDAISDSEEVAVDLQFAPPYGIFDEFSESVLNSIDYTISSFGVPSDATASLAIVLVDHGYYGAYLDSATCDAWFTENEAMFEQVESYILASSLPGQFSKFKVVRGAGEYAEGHYTTSDKPSAEKPFGDVMSMGEQIDDAINGIYVNSQGEIINNGDDNYEYIIAVPYFFEGFSSDYHEKKETLGSMSDEDADGHFERDGNSPDGDAWAPHDYVDYVDESTTYDGEYAVTVVMDGTVFASVASEATTIAVASSSEDASLTTIIAYKGSETNPTTVIIPGPSLSLPDSIGVRDNLVAAVHNTVSLVLSEIDQPPEITSEPARTSDLAALSTDPAAPTLVPGDDYIFWTYSDDKVSCSDMTHQWQYRVAGTTDPMTVNTITEGLALQYVWTPLVNTMEAGTYEMQVVVTDCAGQSVTSGSYYFTVDHPPEIISEPARTSDLAALSTDPAAPTLVPGDDYIFWTYSDDKASCSDMTHQWQYRVAGTTDPMTVNTITEGLALQYVWTPLVNTMEAGTYEMRVVVTDCAGQSVTSGSYYFTVDHPPEIISEPARTSDLAALSTDPAAPTLVPGDDYIFWTYSDDKASCSDMTHQWQYRVAGTTDPMTVNTITEGLALQYVWTPLVNTMEAGTYEMQVVVTDCAEQSVTSVSYYFTVVEE